MLYDVLQRQVYLRSNEMSANDPSTLASNYALATIGQAELSDRAIEFPALAINDAISNAMQKMIGYIGKDRNSPYRTFFHGITANIASGSTIPTVSSTSKPRIGVIGNVRDAVTLDVMQPLEKSDVLVIRNMTLKQVPTNYFTDNVRLWHTTANAVCDIVMFSVDDENAKMVSNPRGIVPFPDDMIESLVLGALSYIARSNYNAEQSQAAYSRWQDSLQMLGIKMSNEERIVNE